MRYTVRRTQWDMRSMIHPNSDQRLAVGPAFSRGPSGALHDDRLQGERKGHQPLMLCHRLIPQRETRFNRTPVPHQCWIRERMHAGANRGSGST